LSTSLLHAKQPPACSLCGRASGPVSPVLRYSTAAATQAGLHATSPFLTRSLSAPGIFTDRCTGEFANSARLPAGPGTCCERQESRWWLRVQVSLGPRGASRAYLRYVLPPVISGRIQGHVFCFCLIPRVAALSADAVTAKTCTFAAICGSVKAIPHSQQCSSAVPVSDHAASLARFACCTGAVPRCPVLLRFRAPPTACCLFASTRHPRQSLARYQRM